MMLLMNILPEITKNKNKRISVNQRAEAECHTLMEKAKSTRLPDSGVTVEGIWSCFNPALPFFILHIIFSLFSLPKTYSLEHLKRVR